MDDERLTGADATDPQHDRYFGPFGPTPPADAGTGARRRAGLVSAGRLCRACSAPDRHRHAAGRQSLDLVGARRGTG